MIFLTATITPTPIPIDNVPEPFRTHLYGFFQGIINAMKAVQIPFTHATIWDFVMWSIIVAAIIKAAKLMYGKGDTSKHE